MIVTEQPELLNLGRGNKNVAQRGVWKKETNLTLKFSGFYLFHLHVNHTVSLTQCPHTHTPAEQMPLFFSLLQYKPQPVLRQKHRNRRPKAVTPIHPIPAQSSDSKFNVVHIFFS